MQRADLFEIQSRTSAEPQEERCAPGGNVGKAARRYGLSEKDIIDFSSIVNTLGFSVAALKAVKRSLPLVNSYPDPETSGLRQAISGFYGVQPDEVACGPGSNGLLHLILRMYRPKRVLIPVPAPSGYARAAETAGSEVVPLQLTEHGGFRVDPVDMAFALKGVDMAILCNPGNPTGRLVPKSEMFEILRFAKQEGVRLVVDEACMDVLEADSLVKDAAHSPHCICLRSFTSFFGMPGLRIGYAVSDAEHAAAIRAAQEPWAVTALAERAAVAALDDWKFIKKTRKHLEQERERLMRELRLLPGVESYPSFAYFLFIKLTAVSGPALTDKLALRGFLVCDCSSFPGLDNRHIRIAVRSKRDNNRLLQALRALLIR